MATHFRPAILMLVLFTLLTGVIYPMAITVIAQLAFPTQANGSLVLREGTVVGSELMGQSFSEPHYFHGRPSAAGKGYDGASTSGSNLGPTSKALMDRIAADVARQKAENPSGVVPTDLVTVSGSGLDPHVSPAAAEFQVPRVARARSLPEERVRALVGAATEPRWLGVLGEPRVNVLNLNLMLDETGGG